MEEAVLTVRHIAGLHARPAALFVRSANRFSSIIRVQNLTRQTPAVNAKSILSLLTLGVEKGHRVRITAEGVDAREAIAALLQLAGSGFSPKEGPEL